MRIEQLSEKAVIIQFESAVDESILNQVLAYQRALLMNSFNGILDMVPTYNALTIFYDPAIVFQSRMPGDTASEKVMIHLNGLHVDAFSNQDNKTVVVPVCYDLKFGLDLKELSGELKLSIDEIIQMHQSTAYLVYMVGFTPGFPYLGTLPAELECSRKNIPRKKVPPGSVGLAGMQTGIYPFETPGGWQIIGRTPISLFSVRGEPPCLVKAGDKIQFESISLTDFKLLNKS